MVLFNSTQIAAQAIASEPPQQAIKMEVGIEDCLHIEFEYDRQKYHLKVLCPAAHINFLFVLVSHFLLLFALIAS